MTDIAVAGPIAIRRFVLEHECQELQGHKHNYDHTTLVLRGSIRVSYSYQHEGKEVSGSHDYSIGESFVVKAEVEHTIKSLEPNSMYACIFSHRDFDGNVVQNYIGNEAATL